MPKIWQAQWVQDPRFDGLEPIDTLGRFTERDKIAQRVIAQHKPGLSNVHMLLRKSARLDAKPSAAQLTLTADDYYKLWVNGQFVGQGPAPGYPWQYYYNTWNIAPYLREGENVIAVHVYYIGLLVRHWNSQDHRMGMICEADITLEDGTQQRLLSDATWQYQIMGKEIK